MNQKQEFLQAASQGDRNLVLQLLQQRISPNVRDETHTTALIYASQKGYALV